MKIFSVAANMHDHNTYDGIFHRQEERYSRKKHNLSSTDPQDPTLSREFFLENFLPNYKKDGNIVAFTYSNLGKKFVLDLLVKNLEGDEFLSFKPTNLWDKCYTGDYYYIDHHQSHAAYAFLSSGFSESDILAIDGQGCTFSCIFVDKFGTITDLSNTLSIGGLWNLLAQAMGLGYLGAGKAMGLSGYGKYNETVNDMIEHYLEKPNHRLPPGAEDVLKEIPNEDVAFTLQQLTVDLVKRIVYPLKTSSNICIAGGVAYNGYMNEEFTKHYENVHVPPAPGDEGQAIGTYMHADYVLNNRVHIPSVYLGKEHEIDKSIFTEFNVTECSFREVAKYTAQKIADGNIVGWHQGKSESGNRALGNRSILADPRNANIKNIINSRIKLREDFRPFAPSVLEENYKEYFNTNQPSPYMARIMPVISDKVPGITHVDGTARIQTVTKEFNEKYHQLISEFYSITGIPMLLNTSFNCREPIVETPQDAVNTFKKCGLDILVINNYIIEKQT
jgi:carbamoyltransferase